MLKQCTVPERKVMSTTSTPVPSPQDSTAARLREFAVGALFAVVLLLPKLLNLRRDRRSWLAFRILLALAGASLVILPLSLWNSWTAGIAGLAMFLAAILLPSAKPDTTLAETAARLGALVIVNGGVYQPDGQQEYAQHEIAPAEIAVMEIGRLQHAQSQIARREEAETQIAQASSAQLFVCPERIWALDAQLRPLLVIPIAQISSAIASESSDEWILRIRWADRTSDFHYRGVFAEHLASVAESTLRGVIHPVLPVIPQKRAATA
jgi:hypothetical protein